MAKSTDWRAPDVLSPMARQVIDFGAGQAYGRLTPIETGAKEARSLLDRMRPEQLLSAPIRSADDAKAALAGLWLYHDFLDESHRISQDLSSATGSFWHAIMHRREGDFSNAKYWYARCRHHPAYERIASDGRSALAGAENAEILARLVQGEWDPSGFVDVVQAIHQRTDDPMYEPAVALQRAEWRALFEHCVSGAAGSR